MAVRILYFASLRERLGVDCENLELAAGVTDLNGLLSQLSARGGVWGEAFDERHAVLMAVNKEMARADTAISDGDEIGLFPPVTGG